MAQRDAFDRETGRSVRSLRLGVAIRLESQILWPPTQQQRVGGDCRYRQEYRQDYECLAPPELLDQERGDGQENRAGEAGNKGQKKQGATAQAPCRSCLTAKLRRRAQDRSSCSPTMQ